MQDKLVEQASKGEACCPNLDPKTRFIGFLITFIVGLIFAFGSIGYLFSIIVDFFSIDAKCIWPSCALTLGILCSLASTFFLFGPKEQCKKMFEPVRVVVSIILLISMIGTIVSSFIAWGFLIAIFACLQIISAIWYALSYVPFAQACCLSCTKACCCGCCGGEGAASEATVA